MGSILHVSVTTSSFFVLCHALNVAVLFDEKDLISWFIRIDSLLLEKSSIGHGKGNTTTEYAGYVRNLRFQSNMIMHYDMIECKRKVQR